MAICVRCGCEFRARAYWQRYCGEECRRAFHVEETRRGRELARRERASSVLGLDPGNGSEEAAA
jgi:hypothetical protein